MSEKLKRLHLDAQHRPPILLGEGKQWHRDIQDIFTPSTSKFYRFFERDLFESIHVDVQAKGNRPAYIIGTHRGFDGDRQTYFANRLPISHPGQAAAWAALRMYLEHPAHAGHPLHRLDKLHAADYNGTSTKFDALGYLHGGRERLRFGGGGVSWSASAELINVPKLGYTAVKVDNKDGKTLPDLLGGIKDFYDVLYPAESYPSADTSAAIAGIVGAHTMESFSAAWDELRDGQPDPVIAARSLLMNSGVFIVQN